MNTIICIPYELLDNYIKEDNKLYLYTKTYNIIKIIAKDTYVEVTYRIE